MSRRWRHLIGWTLVSVPLAVLLGGVIYGLWQLYLTDLPLFGVILLGVMLIVGMVLLVDVNTSGPDAP
jgi:hypothetical protein